MTRPNSQLVLRRASERLSAGAAALALTFLMLLTVDVRAAVPAAVPSVSVSYSDLALGTEAGAISVYRKLQHAARKVCGLNPGVSLTVDRRVAAQSCVDEALADVVRRIGRPILSTVHAASA
jgi:UrcA family protein